MIPKVVVRKNVARILVTVARAVGAAHFNLIQFVEVRHLELFAELLRLNCPLHQIVLRVPLFTDDVVTIQLM